MCLLRVILTNLLNWWLQAAAQVRNSSLILEWRVAEDIFALTIHLQYHGWFYSVDQITFILPCILNWIRRLLMNLIDWNPAESCIIISLNILRMAWRYDFLLMLYTRVFFHGMYLNKSPSLLRMNKHQSHHHLRVLHFALLTEGSSFC